MSRQLEWNRYHSFQIWNPLMKFHSMFTVPVRYTNLEFLACGAHGTVVTAHDICHAVNGSPPIVVIKKLEAPFRSVPAAKSSYRELVLLKTFQHRNIIKLLNAFSPNESLATFEELYLVMEYAEQSLVNVSLRAPGVKLSHLVISSVIYQILSAVKHLHDSGIRHRDLKTVNIAHTGNGVVKLLDFGGAKQNSCTFQTQYVVTRSYRAPEVIVSGKYDDSIDIWSVGCMMAELILGRVFIPYIGNVPDGPFQDNAWLAIVNALGAPDDGFFQNVNLFAAQYYRDLCSGPAKSMHEIFPDSCFMEEFSSDGSRQYLTPFYARDLISKMLKMNPEERCSVQEAINHPYLAFHRREEQVNIPPKIYNYNPNIENIHELIELKELLFDEVKSYEKGNDIYNHYFYEY